MSSGCSPGQFGARFSAISVRKKAMARQQSGACRRCARPCRRARIVDSNLLMPRAKLRFSHALLITRESKPNGSRRLKRQIRAPAHFVPLVAVAHRITRRVEAQTGRLRRLVTTFDEMQTEYAHAKNFSS